MLGLRCYLDFSLVAGSGAYSLVAVPGLLFAWLLLLWSTGSRACISVVVAHWLSSCSSWALEHRFELWHTGLVAPWHMGSSWTRDRTHVSCIGGWTLYHSATWEAPIHEFFFYVFLILYWNIIALQNFTVFCQASTLISHRYTYVPSLLNPALISLSVPPL